MNLQYEVGQILYTIIKDKQIIVPIKVIEQIITKNLDSEKIEYKVLLPNKKGQKVSLSKFENIFEELDKINEYLVDKAKQSIEKMLEDAIELEDMLKDKEKSIDVNVSCKNEINNDKINGRNKIILEDGTLANIIDNSEKDKKDEKEDSITWRL